MKHIVFAHRKLSYGGGERVLIEQVAALADCPEVEVSILFRKEPDRRDVEPEIRTRHPRIRGIHHIPGPLGAFRWLWRERPDLLVVCNHKGVQRALPWLARLGRRVPVVVTLHEHYARHLQKYQGISRLVDRWLITWAFPEAVARDLGPQPCAMVHPLYPRPEAPMPKASDRQAARRSLKLPEAGVLVGYVGQLDGRKDPDAVLRMGEALSRALGQPIHLLFAGRESADASAILDRATEAFGARGVTVHRLGPQKDLGPVFTALDLYILASRNEGFFPLALIEAMEHGVPLAAVSVGGIATQLPDGQGGFLVRKPDDRRSVDDAPLKEAAARIAPLLQDPEAWQAQRELAHAFATRLTAGYDAAARTREALAPWL